MAGSHPLLEGFTELDMFSFGSVMLFEALFGFSLNMLTIVSFWKIKELRIPGNFLIFNLALSDCGLCINAFITAFSSYLRYWPYGSEGCQFHGFQGFLAALTSINSAAAIAWDRYHQYCAKNQLPMKSTVSMGLLAWSFAAFWSVMPLLGWGNYNYEPLRTCCTLDYTRGDRNYIMFLIPLVLFNFIIPIFIMLTSYHCIDHKFRKTGQCKFNTSLPVKSLILCWGPYSLLSCYAAIGNVSLISPKILMIPGLIAKTSPIINAFVYAVGNENYREGIWRLLTERRKEKASVDNKIN